MTGFQVARIEFSKQAVAKWRYQDGQYWNWPFVHILSNKKSSGQKASTSGVREIYVGETLNAVGRMRQHLESPAKQHLTNAGIIFSKTFNKSVCLDLKSYLIRMIAGDGANKMLNRNNGITDAQYYQRAAYRAGFQAIFDNLKSDGVFTRTVPEIENSSLFKLSPYKGLTEDQALAVEDILDKYFLDLSTGGANRTVLQGDPALEKRSSPYT
jgi:hypothetical protein